MLRWYGFLGILLIAFGEFLIFDRIEPFSTYLFFISLWLGYIFLVDALVYYRTKRSRLTSDPKSFWILFIISAAFWWFYEILNFFIDNWRYESVGKPEWLIFTIAFSTVLPAIFVTSDLLYSFKIFEKFKSKLKITKRKLSWFLFLGIVFLILPFVLPKYAFGLVWVSMFFLLDPINYLNKSPSIIGQLAKGKHKLMWTIMIGTLICGFFWEFWNFWAPAKWYYFVPFVGFWKVFEMPLLGFLGYLPFGLSLYAMYYFFIGLFKKK